MPFTLEMHAVYGNKFLRDQQLGSLLLLMTNDKWFPCCFDDATIARVDSVIWSDRR